MVRVFPRKKSAPASGEGAARTEERPRRTPRKTPAVRNILGGSLFTRSEERRVGKECRSLCDWSSDVCSSDLGPRLGRGCCPDGGEAKEDAEEDSGGPEHPGG